MRVALDATYVVDPHPSGIAVYSRELLDGLASAHPADEFIHCYRLKQLRSSRRSSAPNVRRRLLLPEVHGWLPGFKAGLFHALNQRVDARPAGKVVSTFHDLFVMTGDYSSAAFRERFTLQARQAAKNSDLIIAVSEFTAGQVASLLHVEPSRLRVVPHGVEPPPANSQLRREKLILFVGALQVRKNISRLVEAFEAMPRGEDWRLVFAGAPTGFGAAAILQRVEASSCRERMEITGYLSRPDLERLYARASIFAFPSLDEGFGLPVLEAMARGIPVVTSNRSALPEVAGSAALLVDPENVEHIAHALSRLAGDLELRKDLISLGFARASTYPWKSAVDATYAIYRELLTE